MNCLLAKAFGVERLSRRSPATAGRSRVGRLFAILSELNVCFPMIKAIFFDAVGTLFRLTNTVGGHYAYVGGEVGLDLDAQNLERAFHTAWKQMPQRAAIDGPRENDD